MLPIRVFVDVFGAPESDADYLAKLANMLVAVDDPDLAPPPEMYERARARGFEPHHLPFSSPAALELFDYARALCEARRKDPQDDLITRLVSAEWEGERLTDSELVNFCQLLVFAGNETTRNSLATGMHQFILEPEQFDRVQAGTPGGVEPSRAGQQHRVVTGGSKAKAQRDRGKDVPGFRSGDQGDPH